MRRSLRMCRGEEDRERPALRLAHHGRALAADRVHHGADVVHSLLERRRAGHAVGHPHPALVEEDQPRELRQPLAVAPELREFPVDLQVRGRALRVHEVDRPVSDDAIGDVDVSAPGEAHLRHAASIDGSATPEGVRPGERLPPLSSAATRRASGPSDSSDDTSTLLFSPTRS